MNDSSHLLRNTKKSLICIWIAAGIAVMMLLFSNYAFTTQSIVTSAYAKPVIRVGCGPTQQSSLSISIGISGFQPNAFISYTITGSDRLVRSGGFSSGPSGENTLAYNVGPDPDRYTVQIYKNPNSSNLLEPIYSSTILVPCPNKHFEIEYYKNNPQIIQYLLGIKSTYNEIKLGDYVVSSVEHAYNIFDADNSNNPQDQLAAQLLIAKLNIANGGAGDCISSIIDSADYVLRGHKYSGINGINNNTNIFAHINNNISKNNTNYMLLNNELEDYNSNGCRGSNISILR